MNQLNVIGNLCADPETRTTSTGKNVCSFRVAVNSGKQGQEATFFKVSAWDKLAEICQKFLTKGKKAMVSGPVSVETYTNKKGENVAQMCITAREVEFLSAKDEGARPATVGEIDKASGMQVAVTEDELPF